MWNFLKSCVSFAVVFAVVVIGLAVFGGIKLWETFFPADGNSPVPAKVVSEETNVSEPEIAAPAPREQAKKSALPVVSKAEAERKKVDAQLFQLRIDQRTAERRLEAARKNLAIAQASSNENAVEKLQAEIASFEREIANYAAVIAGVRESLKTLDEEIARERENKPFSIVNENK